MNNPWQTAKNRISGDKTKAIGVRIRRRMIRRVRDRGISRTTAAGGREFGSGSGTDSLGGAGGG